MILATEELVEVLEPALALKLGTDVEIIAFTHMKVYFYLKSTDGKWVEGYVQVDYDTDLAVYIRRPDDGYAYAGDINWCDILPEGIE